MLNENRFLGTFRGHNTRTTRTIMLIHAVVRSQLSLFEDSLGILYAHHIFVYYKFIIYKHTFRMF